MSVGYGTLRDFGRLVHLDEYGSPFYTVVLTNTVRSKDHGGTAIVSANHLRL